MNDKLVLALLFALLSPSAVAWDEPPEGTFSIIARDTVAGELGMAVQSKAHAVGSRTVSAKGGLAVIAHQATSNPMYGQLGLDLLARGMTPQQALDFMVRGDEGRDPRFAGTQRRMDRQEPERLEGPPLHAGLLRPGKYHRWAGSP